MKKIVTILFACLLQAIASSQTVTTKLDEFLTTCSTQNKFNGTALVAQKGKVLLQKGYGIKDAGTSALNNTTTIYQVGSVTKQFTSAIILRLQEQHKLSVKDKLSKYFPEYPDGDKIIIENLLTHTSGIYSYTSDSKFMATEITKAYTREKMMALFKDKPLEFEPGTKWSYSNSGYSMLGYVIEKVTGKPYEKVMREMILEPLQMNHSGFDFAHLKSPDKATGYITLNENAKAAAPIVDSSVSYAAGSLYSSVEDLYKWERAISANKILSPGSWKMAFTPFRNKYGYGWFIDTMYAKLITAHGGGIHGFNANLLRIPQEEIAIILLNNKGNPHLDEITRGIAAILLGEKYDLPKERVQIKVADSILQQYVGEYDLSPAFKITVWTTNGMLKAQATGQPEFELFAEKEHFFFLKVVDAQVEFIKGADGKIEKMILFQNGMQLPGKKIK
ncbi:MAG: serine hydrolase [Chitinophagaceae bacterium]